METGWACLLNWLSSDSEDISITISIAIAINITIREAWGCVGPVTPLLRGVSEVFTPFILDDGRILGS